MLLHNRAKKRDKMCDTSFLREIKKDSHEKMTKVKLAANSSISP
jgi:hypothetical protein